MSIQSKLTGRDKDLGGGFMVRRLLPAAHRQSVGPFLFFDHFGPVTVEPGVSHDVRPHPHIGLATVTKGGGNSQYAVFGCSGGMQCKAL